MNLPQKLKNNKYIDPLADIIQSMPDLTTIPSIGILENYRVYSWSLNSYKNYYILQDYRFNKYRINTVSLKQYIKTNFPTMTYFILPFYLDKIFFSVDSNKLLVTGKAMYSVGYLINSININDIENIIESINPLIYVDFEQFNEYINKFIDIFKSYKLLTQL